MSKRTIEFEESSSTKKFEADDVSATASGDIKKASVTDSALNEESASNQHEVPNRHPIIQKAYEAMRISNWDRHTQELYFLEKRVRQEYEEEREYLKYKVKEEFKRGELKGEIQGEISKIKTLINLGIEQKQIVQSLNFLTMQELKDKLENNIEYIKDHVNETDRQICEDLDLLRPLYGLLSFDSDDGCS